MITITAAKQPKDIDADHLLSNVTANPFHDLAGIYGNFKLK